MIKYEVGKVFPIETDIKYGDSCRAHINGSSFDVMYYIDEGTNKDKKVFKDSLLRLHLCVIESIPFVTVSYLGSNWTYDFTINVLERDGDVLESFFSAGNAVIMYLIDTKTNVLQAARMIGLPEEAENMIKDACKEQMRMYSSISQVNNTINSVYSSMSTDELIKISKTFEFKKR